MCARARKLRFTPGLAREITESALRLQVRGGKRGKGGASRFRIPSLRLEKRPRLTDAREIERGREIKASSPRVMKKLAGRECYSSAAPLPIARADIFNCTANFIYACAERPFTQKLKYFLARKVAKIKRQARQSCLPLARDSDFIAHISLAVLYRWRIGNLVRYSKTVDARLNLVACESNWTRAAY